VTDPGSGVPQYIMIYNGTVQAFQEWPTNGIYSGHFTISWSVCNSLRCRRSTEYKHL